MFKRDETRQSINNLIAEETEGLRRQELLGIGFDFNPTVDLIAGMMADFKNIIQNEASLRISDEAENSLKNLSGRLLSQSIQSIRNFVARDNPNASQQFTNITNEVDSLYNEFTKVAGNLLVEIRLNNLTPGKIKSEFDSFNKFKNEAETLFVDLQRRKQEAEDIIRQASGIKATEASSNIFKGQADEHEESAKNWFIASVVVLVSLFVILIVMFKGWWPFIEINNTDKFSIVHNSIFRVLILSAAYYLLHLSIKNYKVHRHLYIMNKHRHNSLEVYPKMLTAGEDAETRNLIVSQAAKSIFEQSTSGYLSFDDDPRPINPTSVINKFIEKK